MTGLLEIYFGAFARAIGADLQTRIWLFDIAGYSVAIGGVLGILLVVFGWLFGNKPMIFHGFIAVSLGAILIVSLLTGSTNANFERADTSSRSGETR